MFNLPVTLWVCHRSVAYLYVELLAPIFEFRPRELSAIVCDDPVGNAESDHNILEEFLCFSGYDHGDRFGFDPLGELVDGDEEVCVTIRRSLQGPTMSRPQIAKGQVTGMVCSSWAG